MLLVNRLRDVDVCTTLILRRIDSNCAVCISYDTCYIVVLVYGTILTDSVVCLTLVDNTLYRALSLTDNTCDSSVVIAVLSVRARNITVVDNGTLTINLNIALYLTDDTTHRE